MMIRNLFRFISRSSTGKKPELGSSLNQAFKTAKSIEKVLSAYTLSNAQAADSAFRLRMIGQLMKSDPEHTRLVLKDTRYTNLKADAARNISILDPKEIINMLYWYRICCVNNLRELNKSEEDLLIARMEELCLKGIFTGKELAYILFNISEMRRHSIILEEKLLLAFSDQTATLPLESIRLILLALQNTNRPTAKQLISSCLKWIENEENFTDEHKYIIDILRAILKIRESVEIPGLSNARWNLQQVLISKVNRLNEIECIDLLEFYVAHSSFPKALLRDLFKKIRQDIHKGKTSKLFIMRLMKKYYDFHNTSDVGTPRELIGDTVKQAIDRVDEFNINEFSRVIFNASCTCKDFPANWETSILEYLSRREQPDGVNFALLARAFNILYGQFPLEFLINDRKKLLGSFNDLPTAYKLESLEQLAAVKLPDTIIEELKNVIIKDLKDYCSKSWGNARAYTYDFLKYNLYHTTLALLEPVNKRALEVLEAGINTTNFSITLRKAHDLVGKIPNHWEEFVTRNKRFLSNPSVEACLRDSSCNITLPQICYLFQLHKPNIYSVNMAASKISVDMKIEDIKAFLPYFDAMPDSCYASTDFNTLDNFFFAINCYELGSYIKNYASRISNHLKNFNDIKAIKAASYLAPYKTLDTGYLKKLISKHKISAFGTTYNEIIKIVSFYPGSIEYPSGIIRNAPSLKFSNELTINRILAYMNWEDNSLDDEFLESIRESIESVDAYKLSVYCSLLKKLGYMAYGNHKELVRSLVTEISDGFQNLKTATSTEECLELLDVLSHFYYIRCESAFSSLTSEFNNRYKRLLLNHKVRMIIALCRRGIKDENLIKNFAEDMLKTHVQLSPLSLSSAAELGFHNTEWAQDIMKETLKTYKLEPSQYLVHWIWTLFMFKAPEEHINAALEVWRKQPCIPHLRSILVNNELMLRNLTPHATEIPIDPLRQFGLSNTGTQVIASVLSKKFGQAQQSVHRKGIWAPIYLPRKDTVIWPISHFAQTYNKEHLKGGMMMHYDHLSQVARKVITVDRIIEKEIHQWVDDLNL